MRYRQAAITLGIVGTLAFAGAFLFSYKLSPKSLFNFEIYVENLKEAGRNLQSSLKKPEEQETEVSSEESGSESGEAFGDSDMEDVVVYPNLKSYEGKNPYSTVLSDRDIVRNARYLLGAEGYSHLVKSMSDAKEVVYDQGAEAYTVEGSSSSIKEQLSGILQIRENGLMYVVFLWEEMVLYYTNDEELYGKIAKGSHIEEWMERNSGEREIVYMNKIAK